MYLAKNIRYLRKQRGLSQEQVASAFGYDNYTTVQKWESEKSDPPIKVVKGLAELFGVDLDDLVKTDLELTYGKVGPAPAVDPSAALRPDESSLLSDYNRLNPLGRDEASKRVKELTQIESYIKDTGSQSA